MISRQSWTPSAPLGRMRQDSQGGSLNVADVTAHMGLPHRSPSALPSSGTPEAPSFIPWDRHEAAASPQTQASCGQPSPESPVACTYVLVWPLHRHSHPDVTTSSLVY